MELTEIAEMAEEVRQFNLPKRHMKHANQLASPDQMQIGKAWPDFIPVNVAEVVATGAL